MKASLGLLLAASTADAFVLRAAPARPSTRHAAPTGLDFFSQCETSRLRSLLRMRGGGALRFVCTASLALLLYSFACVAGTAPHDVRCSI